MLTEILCDKFLDGGKERGPIRFKRGLNVVLGDEKATNSIGKSTFLLAVDFAFGGSAYAQSDKSMKAKRRVWPDTDGAVSGRSS